MNRVIRFRVQPRLKATCEECKAMILPSRDGMFEVSPHLREMHGFTDADIEFVIVSEVICPPMVFMEARQ